MYIAFRICLALYSCRLMICITYFRFIQQYNHVWMMIRKIYPFYLVLLQVCVSVICIIAIFLLLQVCVNSMICIIAIYLGLQVCDRVICVIEIFAICLVIYTFGVTMRTIPIFLTLYSCRYVIGVIEFRINRYATSCYV